MASGHNDVILIGFGDGILRGITGTWASGISAAEGIVDQLGRGTQRRVQNP